jgi:hypothetical protein
LAEISSAAGASLTHPLQTIITSGVRSRDEVPGTMLRLQGKKQAKSDTFCSNRRAPYHDTKPQAYSG